MKKQKEIERLKKIMGKPRGFTKKGWKLQEEDKEIIKELLSEGYSYGQVAKQFQVTRQAIFELNKKYFHIKI